MQTNWIIVGSEFHGEINRMENNEEKYCGANSQTAGLTRTASDSGELLLYPAAFTAFTLNTYFSPVVRPWLTNLNTVENDRTFGV